jgi:glyoxylate reductase
MRVFVTQPIAESALARLRQIGEVEVHPDASKPIEKAGLCAGVRRAEIL